MTIPRQKERAGEPVHAYNMRLRNLAQMLRWQNPITYVTRSMWT